ncbi:hypothetical protein V6Z11_D07G195900 [Gossypium hirsutum]
MLMPSALYASVDKYLHGLFGLANDPAAEVRKLVCAAFVQLIEVRPSVLEPHMKNVIEYMLQVNKDTDDEVALEACEFWVQGIVLEQDNIDPMMEKFTEKERELRTSSLTRKQPNTGSKETSLDEVLCRHMERKPFAYGLCNECYEEFMKISGGLDGGSDPPAFQLAEKERLAKLSIQENVKVCSVIILSKGLRTVKG